MSDSPKKVTHGLLIDIAKVLIPGFKDAKGFCEGVNSMLLQAVVTGTKEENEFYDRLKFISDYLSEPGNSIEKLKKDIDNVYKSKILPETTPPLSKEEKAELREANEKALSKEQKAYQNKLTDVLAFFNAATLEHNTQAGLNIFNTKYQLDKDNVHPNIASKALEKSGRYIHTTTLGIVIASKVELTNYFAKITEDLEKNQKIIHERTSVLLTSDNHTLSIYFDKSTTPGKWRFFDVNDLDLTENGEYYKEAGTDFEYLADLIFNGLLDNKNNNVNTAFAIRRVSTRGYDLALMSDLDSDPKTGAKLPLVGKIYLSEEGNYVFYDTNHKSVVEGVLQTDDFDLTDLKEKFDDFDFKTSMIEHIAKVTGVPLVVDALNKKINADSEALRFRTQPSNKPRSLFNLVFGSQTVDTVPIPLSEKTNSRGRNALYFAVKFKQLTLAKKIIDENKDKLTPVELQEALTVAADTNQTELIEILIDAGASDIKEYAVAVQKNQLNALTTAVTKGQTSAVETLITLAEKQKAPYTLTEILKMLTFAAKLGHTDTLNAIISLLPPSKISMHVAIALEFAAINGQAETILALIHNAKADIEKPDNKGNTALMLAANNGHWEAVRTLIKAGSNINAQNKSLASPLILASQNGHLDSVNALISGGADVNLTDDTGYSALRYAAEHKQFDIVRALIKAGADLPPNLDQNMLQFILRLSVKEGYFDMVKKALAAGADVNYADKTGFTALMIAADKGNVEIVRYLISAGADKTALSVEEEVAALFFAITKGDLQTVIVLIEKDLEDIQNAMVNSSLPGGLTMLMLAAQDGKDEIVDALIQFGGNVQAIDEDNCTALMLAAANGHLKTVKKLLDAGAQVDVKDKEGNTALKLAQQNEHAEVAQLLQNQQALKTTPDPLLNKTETITFSFASSENTPPVTTPKQPSGQPTVQFSADSPKNTRAAKISTQQKSEPKPLSPDPDRDSKDKLEKKYTLDLNLFYF